MKQRIKIGIYIIPVVVAVSVALSVSAQQTQSHRHDQSETQPQSKTEQPATTMSHDSCPMMKGEQAKTPVGADTHAGHLASVNARGETCALSVHRGPTVPRGSLGPPR